MDGAGAAAPGRAELPGTGLLRGGRGRDTGRGWDLIDAQASREGEGWYCEAGVPGLPACDRVADRRGRTATQRVGAATGGARTGWPVRRRRRAVRASAAVGLREGRRREDPEAYRRRYGLPARAGRRAPARRVRPGDAPGGARSGVRPPFTAARHGSGDLWAGSWDSMKGEMHVQRTSGGPPPAGLTTRHGHAQQPRKGKPDEAYLVAPATSNGDGGPVRGQRGRDDLARPCTTSLRT